MITQHGSAEDRNEPDSRPGYYYVSIYRCNNNAGIGGQFRLLRGPFINDHAGALAAVGDAKCRAIAYDRRAQWDAFGTCRVEEDLGAGILDKLDSQKAQERL